MTEFELGFFVAVSGIISAHDEQCIAADVVRCNGMDETDVSSMSDYDKDHLRKINDGEYICLKGL